MIKTIDIDKLMPHFAGDSNLYTDGDFYVLNDAATSADTMKRLIVGDVQFVPVGRMMLCTQGQATVSVNLTPMQIARGSVVYVPENTYMEVLQVSEDYNFRGVSFLHIAAPFQGCTHLRLDEEHLARFNDYLNLIWKVVHTPHHAKTTVEHLLTAILCDMHSMAAHLVPPNTTHTGSAAERLVQKFLDLMTSDPDMTRSVPAYADRLCVTPNHLSAVVKQQTGRTVMQLLNQHTVLQAKVLLRHTHLPVYEIADMLGFENAAFFSRFFRRETGLTPTDCRK